MVQAAPRPELITARADERPGINAVDDLLAEAESGDRSAKSYQLVVSDGRAITLPEALVRVLRGGAHHLSQMVAVTVLAVEQELSLVQAAELLNITVPQLVQMLARGEVAASGPQGEARIAVGALLAYKQQRDRQEEEALDELARQGEALGLYI